MCTSSAIITYLEGYEIGQLVVLAFFFISLILQIPDITDYTSTLQNILYSIAIAYNFICMIILLCFYHLWKRKNSEIKLQLEFSDFIAILLFILFYVIGYLICVENNTYVPQVVSKLTGSLFLILWLFIRYHQLKACNWKHELEPKDIFQKIISFIVYIFIIIFYVITISNSLYHEYGNSENGHSGAIYWFVIISNILIIEYGDLAFRICVLVRNPMTVAIERFEKLGNILYILFLFILILIFYITENISMFARNLYFPDATSDTHILLENIQLGIDAFLCFLLIFTFIGYFISRCIVFKKNDYTWQWVDGDDSGFFGFIYECLQMGHTLLVFLVTYFSLLGFNIYNLSQNTNDNTWQYFGLNLFGYLFVLLWTFIIIILKHIIRSSKFHHLWKTGMTLISLLSFTFVAITSLYLLYEAGLNSNDFYTEVVQIIEILLLFSLLHAANETKSIICYIERPIEQQY